MAETYKAITNIPAWAELLTSDGVPDNNTDLYKSVPILYRVVQLRCDSLSSAPFAIMKGEEDEVAWPYPTPLSALLWQWEASLLLSGAAYGEVVSNNKGYRKDVRYRNPYDMNVKYANGVLDFRQNSSGATWRNELNAGNYEMVYLSEFDPSQDILPGVGSGKVANIDAKLLYAIRKFPELYFEGGAMPVTILGIDTNDVNEIERIQNWFQRSATSIRNAFRVMGVRTGSITPTTLTPPLKDLSFPELDKMAKDNIAMAFGVKQTLLDSQAANYATAQEDRLSFYEETIKPRARKFEAALNEQLLARDGLRLEFRFNELDIFQEDENDRAELLSRFTTAGLPIELALELAGIELSETQAEMLNSHQDELDGRAEPTEQVQDLRRWQRMAEKRVKDGKSVREFESTNIEPALHGAIAGALENAKTADDVKRLFSGVLAWEGYP